MELPNEDVLFGYFMGVLSFLLWAGINLLAYRTVTGQGFEPPEGALSWTQFGLAFAILWLTTGASTLFGCWYIPRKFRD